MERTIRHRVNVSTNEKGVKTWNATVEVTVLGGPQWHDMSDYGTFELALIENLVQELDKRYPPEGK